MASSKQLLAFLFLALLSSSLHVHARESQFFSKVTKKTEEVVQVPAKTEQQSPKTEQEPNFVPDTQNGYGLFGHESGQLPPSNTAATTTPSGEPFTNSNSNTFNNKEAYVTNSQGMSDTKFMDRGYTNPTEESATTTTTSNLPYRGESGEPFSGSNYNNEEYETDAQGLDADTKFMDRGYTTTATTSSPYTTTTSGEPFTNSNSRNYYNNGAYVTGQQGMSDTRFMDRGYTTPTTTTSTATNTDNNYYYYYNNDGTVIDPQGYTPAAVNNNEFVADPQGVSGRAHTTSTNNQFSGPTKFMDAGYTTTTTTSGEPFTNSKNYYNNDAYVTGQQGMSDTRFMDRGYTNPTTTSATATNTDNNYYYYNKDGTVIDPQGYTTTSAVNNNNYNEFVADPQGTRGRASTTTSTNNQFSGSTKFMDAGYTTTATTTANNQRQGMSDTRFMENGKYYYDAKSDNNYNYGNSRGAEYNTQGYYGNNENNSFDQYKNSNSMEGYQNQQEFQEEDPQEFEP